MAKNEGQNLKKYSWLHQEHQKKLILAFVWRPLHEVQGKYFRTFLINKIKTFSMHNNSTLNSYDTCQQLFNYRNRPDQLLQFKQVS